MPPKPKDKGGKTGKSGKSEKPGKPGKGDKAEEPPKQEKPKKPCPHLCTMMPVTVPLPGGTNEVLHPRKDVFVLKVAKVNSQGDKRCKMELELVTPKGPEKKPLGRIDTREAQCDPEPCCCPNNPKGCKK